MELTASYIAMCMYADTTPISPFGRMTAAAVVTARRWSFHAVTTSADAAPAQAERKRAITADNNLGFQCLFVIRSSLNSDAAEKIHQRLQIRCAEGVEHCLCACRLTAMRLDRIDEGRRPAIVEEVHTIGDSPQRHRPEFTACGGALLDTVGEPRTHVVEQEIGERMNRRRGRSGIAGAEHVRLMARGAAEAVEHRGAGRR